MGNCCGSSQVGSLTLQGQEAAQPRPGDSGLRVPSWNRASSEIPNCSRGSCGAQGGQRWDTDRAVSGTQSLSQPSAGPAAPVACWSPPSAAPAAAAGAESPAAPGGDTAGPGAAATSVTWSRDVEEPGWAVSSSSKTCRPRVCARAGAEPDLQPLLQPKPLDKPPSRDSPSPSFSGSHSGRKSSSSS